MHFLVKNSWLRPNPRLVWGTYMNPESKILASTLNRNLIFVHGKGGVGKTAVSHAIALSLAQKAPASSSSGEKPKVLWITIEDPLLPAGEITQLEPNLWHLNADFLKSFEEYASLKIGISHLTRLFLKNTLIRYLANAAPGIHDLVLLGKIWFERLNYTHVVVDLPSTGYGLAFFQSTENFAKLFRGGPLHRDAEAMLDTFRDSHLSGHLIVALPEEMPLRESIELNQYLQQLFPENPGAFIVNRVFPCPPAELINLNANPKEWKSPIAESGKDYAVKRAELEHFNMRIWRDEKIPFGILDYVPPPLTDEARSLPKHLQQQLKNRDYL